MGVALCHTVVSRSDGEGISVGLGFSPGAPASSVPMHAAVLFSLAPQLRASGASTHPSSRPSPSPCPAPSSSPRQSGSSIMAKKSDETRALLHGYAGPAPSAIDSSWESPYPRICSRKPRLHVPEADIHRLVQRRRSSPRKLTNGYTRYKTTWRLQHTLVCQLVSMRNGRSRDRVHASMGASATSSTRGGRMHSVPTIGEIWHHSHVLSSCTSNSSAPAAWWEFTSPACLCSSPRGFCAGAQSVRASCFNPSQPHHCECT